jgi:hypothetical protein
MITVVVDLDSAVIAFEDLGFTVKKGRLHDNGLLNAHIKFNNNTSFELMSIKGEPTDELAKEYTELLKSGEGGVFLAVTGISIEALANKLKDLGIDYNIIPGKSWDYLTFTTKSGLAHIFFIDYHIKTIDSREIMTHENSVKGIEVVWIEGDEKVKRLLESLGLKPVRIKSDITFGGGQDYFAGSGSIIVLPRNNPNQRPRIKGVSFGREDNAENIIIQY